MNEEYVECSSCNSGWQILLGEELYCGWCGTAVRGFRIISKKPIDDFLIYADEDKPQRLDFEVLNTGLVEISIDDITIS